MFDPGQISRQLHDLHCVAESLTLIWCIIICLKTQAFSLNCKSASDSPITSWPDMPIAKNPKLAPKNVMEISVHHLFVTLTSDTMQSEYWVVEVVPYWWKWEGCHSAASTGSSEAGPLPPCGHHCAHRLGSWEKTHLLHRIHPALVAHVSRYQRHECYY